MSATSINENKSTGTTVGTLDTTDDDSGDTHIYSLISGTGSTDNASFSISGSSLLTAASFSYETKSFYSIRIRSTDSSGATYEEAFTITVNNANETPTDIALSATSVPENQSSGTTVGTLSTTDVDSGDSHTYSLVSGSGNFSISGSSLLTAASFDYETTTSYSITIRTSDSSGSTFDEAFTISITNLGTQQGGAIQGDTTSFSGVVTTYAGDGTSATTDGTGTAAQFKVPARVTTDGTNLFVTESSGHVIRKIVISSGVVTTLAGDGTGTTTDGTGTAVQFNALSGVTTDGTSLCGVEASGRVIRKIQ
ncbi:MAG: cadherin domain-containing protein [SAR324 cluster bacterium]|nr:cadherin domain-containing protein [SAR324 cluster bacterium]